jgi:hypothetical protein
VTRLAGSFETDLPLPDTLAACADGLNALGWPIHSLEGTHIRSSAGTQDGDGVAIVEVELSDTGEGTAFRIVGSDTKDYPLSPDELVAFLDQAQDAIGSRIEEAEAPETAQTAVVEEEPEGEEPEEEPGEEEPEAQAPAGWYSDPEGPGERYWDGSEWTDRRRELERTEVAETPPSRPAQRKAPAGGRWWQDRRSLTAAAIALLLGAAIGAAAAPSGTKTLSRTKTETTKGPSRVRTQTVTETQTQTITAKARSAPPAAAAAGGSAPKPLTTTQCDPSYAQACLDPNAKDYDCAGGGGDGPDYVAGPVVIVGDDHYGLDGPDNDGVGCE